MKVDGRSVLFGCANAGKRTLALINALSPKRSGAVWVLTHVSSKLVTAIDVASGLVFVISIITFGVSGVNLLCGDKSYSAISLVSAVIVLCSLLIFAYCECLTEYRDYTQAK